MLFGRNKNKKKRVETSNVKKPVSVSSIYLECVAYYINYHGKLRGIENPVDNIEFYEEMAGPFYNSAMHFVNFLEGTYNDESLCGDEVFEIDINKMLENADNKTLELFSNPKYPELIYLNDGLYSTHFHTDGQKIYETENIQVLPGLSSCLANDKINKLFNGLNPVEARELLKQMRIYPNDTELDLVIDDYMERKNIQYSFYKSIICLLLIRRSNYGIKRARLFADSLDVPFDFTPFERDLEQIQKKTL